MRWPAESPGRPLEVLGNKRRREMVAPARIASGTEPGLQACSLRSSLWTPRLCGGFVLFCPLAALPSPRPRVVSGR